MPDIQLVVDGRQLEDLLKRLQELEMTRFSKPILKAIGMDIAGKAGAYPAQWPPEDPTRWYERGFGTRTATGKAYRTSERLNTRWYYTLSEDWLKVGNLATYAGYVHGTEDQTALHKKHGWKQLLATAEAELPELIRKLEAQIDKIWGRR